MLDNHTDGVADAAAAIDTIMGIVIKAIDELDDMMLWIDELATKLSPVNKPAAGHLGWALNELEGRVSEMREAEPTIVDGLTKARRLLDGTGEAAI